MGELPRIKALIEGVWRTVELIVYVDTPQGRKARVCWRERIGDSDPEPHTTLLPVQCTAELPGVDYGDVATIKAETAPSGRVATGRVWRTG